MPWKASSVMEERLCFVARLLDGEAMTDMCREFGISRKTGYKIFDRYKEHGLEALTDRSRRPVRYANQLPQPIESLIVRLKGEKPHWGARKIRELLVRRLDGDVSSRYFLSVAGRSLTRGEIGEPFGLGGRVGLEQRLCHPRVRLQNAVLDHDRAVHRVNAGLLVPGRLERLGVRKQVGIVGGRDLLGAPAFGRLARTSEAGVAREAGAGHRDENPARRRSATPRTARPAREP